MIGNDVLRRIRYSFDFNDSKMIKLFELGGGKVSRAEISDWLKKDQDPDYKICPDIQLSTFLNGLIVDKRGQRDGPAATPEKQMSNNLIFLKIKIALNLKSDDVLEILKLADFDLGKHELSALFRKPGHKHYRECKDQILRNFLAGIQTKYRDNQDT